MNHCEAVRAGISVVAFHPTALERQVVIRQLSGDAEIGTSGLPLGAMRIDAAATTAFIGDEVGKFVLQRAPNFLRLAFLELRIELDGAVWPPCTAGSRPHSRIPRDPDLTSEFVESE